MSRFGKIWMAAGLAAGLTPLAAQDLPETILRVAVIENADGFNLSATEDFKVFDLNSGKETAFSQRNMTLVRAQGSGIRVGDKAFSGLIRAKPPDRGFIRVDGRRYRDTVIIRRSGKGLTVINELGLDAYVYGILPREVSPSWPLESLKAQALASRTFALKNLKRHESEGFNLCSKVHCQVYGGLEGEKEETNRAVDLTHNQVILHDGDIINSLFFSNCGGKTEDPRNAWEGEAKGPPYLKPVRCRFCKNEPHYSWEQKLSREQIARALRKNREDADPPVRSIEIASHGKSGRAKFLKIKHAGGTLKLRASRFRLCLGPEAIRSTLFTGIKQRRDGIVFQGRGWGHGVGLCQEGAKGMAKRGKGYKAIVRFYYPGTKIVEWED